MEKQLEEMGLSAKEYLKRIRDAGKKEGYNPKDIHLATDGVHKIMVQTPDGKVATAGRVGYNDFHTYSLMEKAGQVPSGTALKHQTSYLERATKIRGNWKKDPYSSNRLAIFLLWIVLALLH